MTVIDALLLLTVMVALAAMPSASVALVVTRAVTQGTRNGVAVALGIVLGDLVFVMLALLGLAALAQTMGAVFVAIKVAGGFYLIYLGINLLRSKSAASVGLNPPRPSGLLTSFLAGFLLTLGDVKAVYFYLSLFPLFVNLGDLSALDIAIITVITVVAVGGVKIAYALIARRVKAASGHAASHGKAKSVAGIVLISAGSYLVVKI